MCASELNTNRGVIFSVNSLGQQSHWRWTEAKATHFNGTAAASEA